MRSNKLISMLAMTAALVGCSQEELLTVDTPQQLVSGNLANRPVIGNVELGLGMESRMALKEGSALNLAYEEGDKVGAALIDEPTDATLYGKVIGSNNYTGLSWTYADYVANKLWRVGDNQINYTTAGLKPDSFYVVKEKIYSNYPFVRDEDGKFVSEANLVEGNYMFYMPYDANHLNRTRIEAVVPQVQDCSDDVMRETTWKTSEKIQASSTALSQFYKGTMEGFEGAPVLVGYKFLAAPQDGSLIKPSVEMNHLYAYPMITIKNDFNGLFYNETTTATAKARATATMTVDSIQVYTDATTTPLFYKAPVKSAAIVDTLEVVGDWEYEKLQKGAATAELLDVPAATAYTKHKNVSTDGTKVAAMNVPASTTSRVTLKVGKELEYGEQYSFHAVLPAGNYGSNLKARVFVTIDGVRYVIANVTNNATLSTTGAVTKYTATGTASNHTFESRGGNGLELVRGEHFPKAEINVAEDGTKSRKAFAGEAMTISLGGTYNSTTKNYVGGAAFALQDGSVDTNYGIVSNEDFISYLNDWVGRGKTLTETPTNWNTKRSTWAEGQFAFKTGHTVIINAELIKGLKKHTDIGEEIAKLVLTNANLPIASDVKIANIASDSTYTFETLDADKVSFKIKYTGVTFGTNAGSLIAGINIIGDDGVNNGAQELKTATGQSNIVVISSDTCKVTANTKNVSSIKFTDGILNVDVECGSLVLAAGTASTPTVNVVLGANGSLTNANNEFEDMIITNNSAKTIAGTLTDVTVTATYDAAWPTVAIPGASRINQMTVNTATGIKEIALEQAQVNMLANLTNVNVVLGRNIEKIKTESNVTLTNIKSINASYGATEWYSTNNGVLVTKYQWGNSSQKTTLSGISTGAGITIQ